MPFFASANTDSESFVKYVMFCCHPMNEERQDILNENYFFELIHLLLVSSLGVYYDIKCKS